MSETGRDRFKVGSPLFFSAVLIAGMILGFNLRDTLRNKRDIATVVERNDRLEQVIDLINEKYVDSVNSNKLYSDAIQGILKSLDPHTVYIPSEELQEANEELEGEFSGIGVEYSIMHDTVTILSVVDAGPAAKAGLEPGDQIIKVDDTAVAGVHITTDRITHMLKGKTRTQVSVAIKRMKNEQLVKTTLIRDVIPIPSVDVGLMVDENTGYIRLDRFSATVHKEFTDAVEKLKSEGAKQLIIDLRDNPGGYLDQVRSIADELLDDNKLIVYTQGSHAARITYKAEKKGLFEQGKLAVLINEGSASASEILAGAVQDWDRGVIIGRRSFGKGLVQEPYEMDDGSEIRLTIAKYYTPSGRCIQRSFSLGKEAYAEEFHKRLYSDMADTSYVQTDTTRFFTANGRIVYGGGGINPDVHVARDTDKLAPGLASRLYSNELRDLIWKYYLANKKRYTFANATDFVNNFRDENDILYQYMLTFGENEKRELMAALGRSSVMYQFNSYIKAQMARFLFRNKGYYSVILQDDVAVRKARECLNGKGYLMAINGK